MDHIESKIRADIERFIFLNIAYRGGCPAQESILCGEVLKFIPVEIVNAGAACTAPNAIPLVKIQIQNILTRQDVLPFIPKKIIFGFPVMSHADGLGDPKFALRTSF